MSERNVIPAGRGSATYRRADRPAAAAFVVLVAAISVAVLPGRASGGGDEKPEGEPTRGDTWRSLTAGLRPLRKTYSPGLVLYVPSPRRPLVEREKEADGRGDEAREEDDHDDRAEGGEDDVVNLEPLEQLVTDSGLKRVLRRYSLVRLEGAEIERPYPFPEEKAADPQPADPPPRAAAARRPRTVGEVFDLRIETPSLLALDFRERVVWRFDHDEDSELPARSRLRKELDRIWKVNEIYRRVALRMEPILAKARYSFEAKDPRAAVLLMREFDDPKKRAQFDPVLEDRFAKFIDVLRSEAKKAIRKGDAFDQQKKYAEAIDQFDVVLEDYPFRDLAVQVAKRKAEILRKLSLGI